MNDRARPPDPVGVIEATYRIDLGESAWLRGIAEALGTMDRGAGVSVAVAQLGTSQTKLIRNYACSGALQFPQESFEAVASRLPLTAARALFAPCDTTFSLDIVPAVFRRFGFAMETVESLAGDRLRPSWAANGGTPALEVVNVCVYVDDRRHFSPVHRGVLSSLRKHLGTALRLRRLLDTTPPEAVLAPDGRVLHVSEPQSSRARRTALSDAVRRIDRARGRLRRERPEEAVALWRALFDGHWSILEHEERDGRRVMVLRRNEPGAADVASIAPEERPVVLLAALGHTFKSMSYELGLAPATLHARLARAMRTLGVSSRAELVRVYGPIVAGIGSARP